MIRLLINSMKKPSIEKYIKIKSDVKKAIESHQPIVALETSVLTHGLPFDTNIKNSQKLEEIIKEKGATPATIGLIDGIVHVGMDIQEIEYLATSANLRKISLRDIAFSLSQGLSGGTTVAGTLKVASLVGIKVFATGGIGGVHRGSLIDVSADIDALATYPIITVCSGAKSILDLKSTLEILESKGIPVLGLGTDDLPAFFSNHSGIKVPMRVESTKDIVSTAKNHWNLKLQQAILVTVPLPSEKAIPNQIIEKAINNALEKASVKKIQGAAITPFLLKEVSKITHGKSMLANLALLENNARIAAEIALELGKHY